MEGQDMVLTPEETVRLGLDTADICLMDIK